MKIALCQMANAGKPAANLEKSIRAIKEAAENGADLIVSSDFKHHILKSATERGMAVCVGRLRPDTQYDYKFVGLSHNTLRGAAGGGVLLAELLCAEGYIQPR